MADDTTEHCMFRVRLSVAELARAIAEYLEKRTYENTKSVRNVMFDTEDGTVFATAEVWKVPRP